MERKARKGKGWGAARGLRAAAEAKASTIAERRARQECWAHEEALELQAKREAGNRELSEVYNRIFYNTAAAEAKVGRRKFNNSVRLSLSLCTINLFSNKPNKPNSPN